MQILKKMVYLFLEILILPVGYFLVALGLSTITVQRTIPLTANEANKTIYLHTNGVHLDIAINKDDINPQLLQDIKLHDSKSQYLSFGWGEKKFYLNTPTWEDVTVETAVIALFQNSESLVHLTHYQAPSADWVAVQVSDAEFNKMSDYLNQTFKTDASGHKVLLVNSGYGDYDDFYQANGSYTLFNTCNTWANAGFKHSGLKASYWTPFDFGLLNKYR